MEHVIKSLLVTATFIEDRAHQLRDFAIARIDTEIAKADKQRADAVQARTRAWDQEVARHEDALRKIQESVAQADKTRDNRVVKAHAKRARIDLA